MGDYTLLEKFNEEYEGICYNGEIFYDKINKISFCKIYFNLTGFDNMVQRDTYSSAVSEVEKRINEHLSFINMEKTVKKFLTLPLNNIDCCWDIESYYQDFENYGKKKWISTNDNDCIMSEIAPGVWCWERYSNYFLVVETTLSIEDIDKRTRNYLDSFILESLKNMKSKFFKKVKDFENKVKKE